MAVTLQQVAREAGVSISTVSFVMNGKAKDFHISPETAIRIKEVARTLNYRPSGNARALLKGRTDCIGIFSIFMPELLKNNIYTLMFDKINQHFHQKNINTMTFSQESGSKDPIVPKMIREHHVDGVILAHSVPPLILKELDLLRMPTIFLNATSPTGSDEVHPDDAQGMRLAVEHLVQLGHRRILYLRKGSRTNHRSISARFSSFMETMAANGLEPWNGSETLLSMHSGNDATMNFREPEEFLFEQLNKPLNQRPTAIISYSTMWLRQIMMAIGRVGLKVPQDISVICCDQSDIVNQWIPSITHVEIPVVEMGKTAAEMLFSKINHNQLTPSVLVAEKLVVKESTAVPPIDS